MSVVVNKPAVKFCGISNAEDARAASALKPDYVGFVVWPKSKRGVTAAEAAQLRTQIDANIACVGVFVDADVAEIAALAELGTIQVAQLHGHEDEAYIAALRSAVPELEVWQAFQLHGVSDVDAANTSSADMVLVDGGMGDGKTFDWSLLEAIRRPFALAGGLTCENVAEAVERLHPAIVDVSSGIESAERAADGRTKKDPEKMKCFLNEITRLLTQE